MKILVTAGNTLVPIDQVRYITNVFTGGTGASIALDAHGRGHEVTLLTSRPEAVQETLHGREQPSVHWRLRSYRTFEDLAGRLEELIGEVHWDVIIHCAAVSDYRCEGVYALGPGVTFDSAGHRWVAGEGEAIILRDCSARKVKSGEEELWLRLVRTPKLIDRIRGDWKYRGVLVKFKLEAGITEEALLAVAERARLESGADLMVANRLEDKDTRAFLGPVMGAYEPVPRPQLARRLISAVEKLSREARDG